MIQDSGEESHGHRICHGHDLKVKFETQEALPFIHSRLKNGSLLFHEPTVSNATSSAERRSAAPEEQKSI